MTPGMTNPDRGATLVSVAAWQVTDTTGRHNKYYRALVSGSRVVFQYGRIGTVQSSTLEDHPHPARAISAAVAKIDSKRNNRSKGYVDDGPTLSVAVPIDVWSDPVSRRHELDDAFQSARTRQTLLAGSLSDGHPHVVAIVGERSDSRLSAIADEARCHVIDDARKVTVAVIDAALASHLDRRYEPRIRICDLGPAADSDDTETLWAALRMWTPDIVGPQSHLTVCLDNARMIFA